MSTTCRHASVLFVLVGLTLGCGGEIGTMSEMQSQSSTQAQLCVAPPANLEAWWPAEGDANEMTGVNNGTIQGVAFAPGEVGQAFSYGGSGGQVSIGAPNFETPNTGFTVEAWINPTSLGLCSVNNCKTVVHRERDVSSRTWWLGVDGSSIRLLLFLAQPNGGWVDVFSPAVVTSGSFQHIAASYDGNTVTMYYNGSLVATQVVGPANFNKGDPINIGSENLAANGTYDSFAGLIDELSIYSRALSGSEVAAIFGAGTAGKCQTSIVGGEDPDDQEDENNDGHRHHGHHHNRHHDDDDHRDGDHDNDDHHED